MCHLKESYHIATRFVKGRLWFYLKKTILFLFWNSKNLAVEMLVIAGFIFLLTSHSSDLSSQVNRLSNQYNDLSQETRNIDISSINTISSYNSWLTWHNVLDITTPLINSGLSAEKYPGYTARRACMAINVLRQSLGLSSVGNCNTLASYKEYWPLVPEDLELQETARIEKNNSSALTLQGSQGDIVKQQNNLVIEQEETLSLATRLAFLNAVLGFLLVCVEQRKGKHRKQELS